MTNKQKREEKKRGKAATWPDVSSGTKQLWLKSAFLYQFHNQDLGGLVAPLFHAFPSPLFHTHTHTHNNDILESHKKSAKSLTFTNQFTLVKASRKALHRTSACITQRKFISISLFHCHTHAYKTIFSQHVLI